MYGGVREPHFLHKYPDARPEFDFETMRPPPPPGIAVTVQQHSQTTAVKAGMSGTEVRR